MMREKNLMTKKATMMMMDEKKKKTERSRHEAKDSLGRNTFACQ
jgi:hypothetical protein